MLWDRDQQHPLFGTAVVALADIPLKGAGLEIAAPVPVSVDVVHHNSMLVGQRRLQLAVARHIVLSLGAACHPEDLEIVLLSDRSDLDFVTDLPHAVGGGSPSSDDRPAPRRLFVIDHSAGLARWPLARFDDGRTSVLAVTNENDSLSSDANILTVMNEATISVLGAGGRSRIDDATPVGFAHPMAVELAGKLAAVHLRERSDR
jgi:hypothetical protein